MKLRYAFLTFLFLIAVGFETFAKVSRTKMHKDSIYLTGRVYNNDAQVKNMVINVYADNKLIKSISGSSSNRFVTNLPKNEYLTIEISAPDFHTKRFIFDTTLPDKVKRAPKYDFDIDIFQESELEGVNTSFLDFPVGLVAYDEKKEEFIRNKKYTKKMKKTYLKLWAEAQSVDRQSEGLK